MSNNTVSATATGLPLAMATLFKARETKHPLEALARAHEVISAALVETCDYYDYLAKGEPNYSVLEAEDNRRHAALQASILAICAYAPKTLDEARRKAELIIKATNGCVLPEEQVDALLHSFVGVEEATT